MIDASPIGTGMQIPMLRHRNEALYEMMKAAVLKASLDTMGRKDVVIVDHPRPDDFVYGSCESSIALAAKDILIRIKAHFDVSETSILTVRKKMGDQLDERTWQQKSAMTFDLFNEFINHVAGDFKRKLYGEQILTSMSLPTASRGFGELLESDAVRPEFFHAYWLLQGEGYSFVCTVGVQISSEETLKGYIFDPTLEDEAGSIEILGD